METNMQAKKNDITLAGLLGQADYKKRFQEILGKSASTFSSNIVSLVNNDSYLNKCDPSSIIAASVCKKTRLRFYP